MYRDPTRTPFQHLADAVASSTGDERIPTLAWAARSQAEEYHRNITLHLLRAATTAGIEREAAERTIRAAIESSAKGGRR